MSKLNFFVLLVLVVLSTAVAPQSAEAGSSASWNNWVSSQCASTLYNGGPTWRPLLITWNGSYCDRPIIDLAPNTTYLITVNLTGYVSGSAGAVYLQEQGGFGGYGPAKVFFFNQANVHQSIGYSFLMSTGAGGEDIRPYVWVGNSATVFRMDSNDEYDVTAVPVTP